MNQTTNRLIGVLLVLLGASFWGIGGVVADSLFDTGGIDVNWFVSARLIFSGLLLLGIQLFRDPKSIMLIWKNLRVIMSLVIFSLFGVLLVQYSYMASIDAGNAALATLLQYLAPIYIILWMICRGEQKLTIADILSISFTIIGTWLLLTNGSIHGIVAPPKAVIWGVISGLSLAFYTLYAKKLLMNYSSLSVVGWSMILAGVCMSFVHPIWEVSTKDWTATTIVSLAFAIVFGTALAYWMVIESLNYLKAKETTLLGTVEPLAAIICSVIWLKLSFGTLQVVGMTLIILLVLYQSLQKKNVGH